MAVTTPTKFERHQKRGALSKLLETMDVAELDTDLLEPAPDH